LSAEGGLNEDDVEMKLPVISLFSGCGGMDYGFEAAGFETRVAVEMDADCCRTLRENRDWAVIESDIFASSPREILAAAGLKKREAALLIGGPPCQPFSKSGYWAKGDSARLSDPRANTLTAYLQVLEEAQPAAFVLENVSGLAFSGKDEGLRLLLDAINGLNRRTGCDYRPHWQVLKAAEHGVPQLRERLFLVAARDGREFEFPRPKFRDAAEDGADVLLDELPPYRTCWDAFGDLDGDPDGEDLAMRGKWAELLPAVPEGANYLWHTERGGGEPLFGWRRRYWNFLLKLAKDRPSWTIQAQPGPSTGPFHWRNRRLSRRELCRLQTFPDEVRITGSYQEAHRQIGNAVPSLLAEVVGREIRRQFFGLKPMTREPSLLPPVRPGRPGPERVARVPRAYLTLKNTETAHPGTGLGRGALARADLTAA
jgi:DNA (cytosine-5)-methyltransferase 1